MIAWKRHHPRQARFLIVRHPSYQTHAFDIVLFWIRANAPQLVGDFSFHLLSWDVPQEDDYRLCIPWLQDPIQLWSQESFEQAEQLTDWCDGRGIPVINRPNQLTNAGKAAASALIARQGVRAPRAALIRDEDEFRDTRLEIPLPLIVREDWGHRGPMILAESDAEVRRIDLSGFHRPVAIEWIDASREGLYRKYRYVAAGDVGVSHHLQISRQWITRGDNRVKTDQSRDEELAYVSHEDPNHQALQQVRAALRLDMLGIDYGYDRSGTMVVWEANPFPYIHFSRLALKYRNFAIHETLRAIVTMYYRRAGMPVPAALSNRTDYRLPRLPGQWRRPWYRFRETLGRYRRSLSHFGPETLKQP